MAILNGREITLAGLQGPPGPKGSQVYRHSITFQFYVDSVLQEVQCTAINNNSGKLSFENFFGVTPMQNTKDKSIMPLSVLKGGTSIVITYLKNGTVGFQNIYTGGVYDTVYEV